MNIDNNDGIINHTDTVHIDNDHNDNPNLRRDQMDVAGLSSIFITIFDGSEEEQYCARYQFY